MKRIASLTAAIAFCTGFSSSSFAIGAIAIADEGSKEKPGHGIVLNEDKKEVAMAKAERECVSRGYKACKAVVWFYTCGAFASSNELYGYGYGATKQLAEAGSMKMCGPNCTVKVSACE